MHKWLGPKNLDMAKIESNEVEISQIKNRNCLSKSHLSTLKMSCQAEYVGHQKMDWGILPLIWTKILI